MNIGSRAFVAQVIQPAVSPVFQPAKHAISRLVETLLTKPFIGRLRNSTYAIKQLGILRGGILCFTLLLAGMIFTGCKGVPTQEEKRSRQQTQALTAMYRPQGVRPELSSLTTNSTLADYLKFAMLNQPQVEAAYYDWLASVERITQERSLPDPQITFQMDITSIVTSIMPGFLMNFPGPGKLGARAAAASADSEGKYFAFESTALQTAFAFKKAYYQLHFLTDKIFANQQTLELVIDLEKVARQQNEVGKATLQDVLRAQIEQDRMKNEIVNLEDLRKPLVSQLKAALGLKPDQPDPVLPAQFETTPMNLTPDQLLTAAYALNPRLKAMATDISRAEAAIKLAAKARMPDFFTGLMADSQAGPVLYRPLAGFTVPLWRDKIAAQMAEAQHNKRAAQARLSAEQVALAVDLAEKSYLYREASRNLALIQEALLPKARLALDVARSGYVAGKTDFINTMDAWRTLLGFQISEVETRTQQEQLLAELSLVIVGQPPAQAPLLSNTTNPPALSGKPVTDKSHAK